MPEKEVYDTVIIGSGVSGLAAAIYCGRFKMKTLVIGEALGGTITLAGEVENYPGFESVTGIDLASKIRSQARKQETVTFSDGRVTRIIRHYDEYFTVMKGEESYLCKTIIFATGTEWRKLGVPGEEEYTGKGVHYCALCDAPFYKNKTVAVIGGSDGAAKEALLLADQAKKVYIIMLKDELRSEPVNTERVLSNPKIEFVKNNKVSEIKGSQFVNSVILDNPFNNSTQLNLDGVFIAIGHVPLTRLAKDILVRTNERDEIIIDQDGNTNITGFFAAGDVCSRRFKQAITGVGEGVTAAYTAFHYLNEHKFICIRDDREENPINKYYQ